MLQQFGMSIITVVLIAYMIFKMDSKSVEDRNFTTNLINSKSVEDRNFTTNLFIKLVSYLHDNNRNKVAILEKATIPIDICQQDWTTAHYVLYKGHIFGITVAHFGCDNFTLPSFVNMCPDIDIAILSECPPDEVSLLQLDHSIAQAHVGKQLVFPIYRNVVNNNVNVTI